MLNDLLLVERAMAAHGIGLVGRHPDIKDMAKGWALRVRLKADGRIAGVGIVEEAGRGALWTLRDGQHNGFPGLKTAAGLLLLDTGAADSHSQAWDADKEATNRRAETLRLIASYPANANQISSWPNAGHRKRIGERLQALRSLAGDPSAAAVPAAFERFLRALDASPPFLLGLIEILAERVRNRGDEWIEPVRSALIGPIALAIDTEEGDFARSATDSRQIGPVSVALSAAADLSDDAAKSVEQCALTGNWTTLHTGPFPQPNLPGLGQTYIFARNKDIPSLTRYGRTADASFRIGSDLVRRLSGAITALTREEAKGRSWRLIPAETGDKPDLLIASVALAPEARLADAVAEDSEDEVSGESAWDVLGKQIIEQSQGIDEQEFPQDQVVVLILRSVDPANRKAVYHRKTTTEEIYNAAQRWRAATSNAPDWLGFPIPERGASGLTFQKPPYVAPLSITPLSRILFANGGRRRVSVIGVTAATAFGLFLQEGDIERRALPLLRLLMRRHGALLSGLAASRHKGIEHLKDFDPKTDLRRDALRSITWLCVLLFQLDRLSSKDPAMSERIAYTDDAAFLLGQFLSAADLVHVGYCADLRGGDVPPTLLGNSVLTIAGSDPIRALSILQTRLKPYLGWASRTDRILAKAAAEEKQGNKGRAIALRQGLSQARRADGIADDIHTMLAPYMIRDKKPDDAFRAELLLGYMAGFPPSTKKETDGAALVQINTSSNQDGG